MREKLLCMCLSFLFFGVFAQAEILDQPLNEGFKITIKNSRNGNGGIGLSLYDEAGSGSFPTDSTHAVVNAYLPLLGKKEVTFVIPNLKAGHYAAAVYHDENGNKVLDTNFFGLPVEGVAVSRNARASFGLPSFSAAKVLFDSAHDSISINIEY